MPHMQVLDQEFPGHYAVSPSRPGVQDEFPTIAPCSCFGLPFAVTLYLQSAGKDLSNGLSYELQAHVLEGAMSLAPSNSQDQTAYRDKIQRIMSAVFSDWKMWQEANISETSEGLSLRVESDGKEIHVSIRGARTEHKTESEVPHQY